MPTKSVKKAILKHPKKKILRMKADEKRIIREMHFDRKMKPNKIAECVGRHLSSVCWLLQQRRAPKPIGPPRKLTEEKLDKLAELVETMVDDADGEQEVTLAMIMRRSRLKLCERVVRDGLGKRGYKFRHLRSKPILTPDDIQARSRQGCYNSARSKAFGKASRARRL